MECGIGDGFERPFPSKTQDAEDDVDDLQRRDGLDCSVEILGEEVPEDLGPEETLDPGGHLIWDRKAWSADESEIGKCCLEELTSCSSEDDQSCPVVLDEFAHLALCRRVWRLGIKEETGLVGGPNQRTSEVLAGI